MLVQHDALEEAQALADGHAREFGDVAPSHLHVGHALLQAGAVANGAGRFATVAAGQHAILDLVAFFLAVLEEGVDAVHAAGAVPEQFALGGVQFAVGAVDGEAVLGAVADEVVLPLAELLAAPAGHAIVIDAEGLVGDHQVGVDTDDAAVALALRAGAHRVVEAEHVGRGLLEDDAVHLEAVAEGRAARFAIAILAEQYQITLPFEEGRLGAVGHAARRLLVAGRHRDAVDHQVPRAFAGVRSQQKILYAMYVLAVVYARVALLLQDVQVLAHGAARRQVDGRHEQHLAARGEGIGPGHHVLHRVALHLAAAVRAVGAAGARSCSARYN